MQPNGRVSVLTAALYGMFKLSAAASQAEALVIRKALDPSVLPSAALHAGVPLAAVGWVDGVPVVGVAVVGVAVTFAVVAVVVVTGGVA